MAQYPREGIQALHRDSRIFHIGDRDLGKGKHTPFQRVKKKSRELACKRILNPPHAKDTTDGRGWMTRSPMEVYLFRFTSSAPTRSLTSTSFPSRSLYLHCLPAHSSFFVSVSRANPRSKSSLVWVWILKLKSIPSRSSGFSLSIALSHGVRIALFHNAISYGSEYPRYTTIGTHEWGSSPMLPDLWGVRSSRE